MELSRASEHARLEAYLGASAAAGAEALRKATLPPEVVRAVSHQAAAELVACAVTLVLTDLAEDHEADDPMVVEAAEAAHSAELQAVFGDM